jgi:beta-glucosidase
VQVYVTDEEASVARPVRELKGFTKLRLQPGASERVTIEPDQRAFAFWSQIRRDWVVESGAFSISVGSSSRDLPLRATIDVTAPSSAEPLTRMSTLHEWLADPIGGRLIESALGNSALTDPHIVKVIGTMPMDTLAAFGFGLTHSGLATMVDAWEAQAAG